MSFYCYHQETKEVVRALLRHLLFEVRQKLEGSSGLSVPLVHIALSGGRTPALLFDIWVDEFKEQTPWDVLRFYWVDERMVPPDDELSNYGLAYRHLLAQVPVLPEAVHRIRGEADPIKEAEAYSRLVYAHLPIEDNVPVFDFVLLGMGTDGHTSSIFPGQDDLLQASLPYVVTVHPETGQQRIAMTGNTMIKALHTWFLIIGKDKTDMLHQLMRNENRMRYPAAYVLQAARNACVFGDVL